MKTQCTNRRQTSRGAGGADVPGVVSLVSEVLTRALAAGASDIHFEPLDGPDAGLLVRVRVDGILEDLFESLPAGTAESVIGRLKVMAGLLTYRMDIPQEGSLEFQDAVELRVATFPTVRGERAVVRVFGARTPVERLDALGFQPAQTDRLEAAAEGPAGMILVTGPAGAGKTTTLYSLVRHVRDTTPGRSIITIEDPVERRIDRVTQIQINPHGELGYDVCMRSLLRQDPQVLLIGEIRDARTAATAVEAALTGHLILTTMHSGDPAEAVLRLLEMGIPPYQVVSAVTVVCAQRLLRRTTETGYRGRVACGHVVGLDEELRQLVLGHPGASQLRSAMAKQPPDMAAAARALAAAGVTDSQEVRRVLGDTE